MKRAYALSAMALLCFSSFSDASTVAVIDSGVDYQHPMIAMWANPGEVADNQKDDDGNQYVDDVYGWNFAENNNQVIDYQYLGSFSPLPYRFFEVQKRVLQGKATDKEIEWMQNTAKNPLALMELQKFGNFIHGTHVSGIAAKEAPAEILAVKLIPTEVKPFILEARGLSVDQDLVDLRDMILKGLINKLASTQGEVMASIGSYLSAHRPQVANGSFGTGVMQAKALVAPLFQALYRRAPSEEELLAYSRFFLESFLKQAERMVSANPETLFVFAAGNERNDNDSLPTSPASVDRDNVMAVAAGHGNVRIASFSNFGRNSVDVIAPGVAINSSIPGNQSLELSGTSQAAPFVANVAAHIRELNPDLSAVEVKRLIMETVDKRAELADKVASSGVVNQARAIYAAKQSLEMPLKDAIAKSLQKVDNQPESFPLVDDALIYPISMPSLFSW